MQNLNIILDKNSKVRLYFQLYSQISSAIDDGTIPQGTKLPSIRTLSNELDASKNTIQKAYDELIKDGYIISREKSGYFASSPNQTVIKKQEELEENIPTVDSILEQRKNSTVIKEPQTLESLVKDTIPALNNTNNQSVPIQIQTLDFITPTETSIIESNFDKPLERKEGSSVPKEIDTEFTSVPLNDYVDFNVPNSFEELESDFSVSFDHKQLDEEESVPTNDNPSLSFNITKEQPIFAEDPEMYNQEIPKSLEDNILASYHNLLTAPSIFLHKKSPAFGEKCLKLSIITFLKSFRNLEVDESNIIIASTHAQLIQNILSLPTFSKTSNGTDRPHGLLQIAAKVNSGEQPLYKTTVAAIKGIDLQLEKTLHFMNLDFVSVEQDDQGIIPKSLESTNANVLYASPKDIPSGFLEDLEKRRNEILEWMYKNPQRYIIDYDTSTEKGKELTFKKYDTTDHVVYISSFANLICKGINGAFCVLPKKLTTEYHTMFSNQECTLSLLDQLFLTDFINSGKLSIYLENLECL